ncbi:hypothetical protein GCM10010357_13470 [Streptomyces luteireticuli]|uniref:Uncharacterized protein n=1 Tax=Streptomyces luteireticuli TaxID=173858 RepID=A0ABP3I8Q7_9ACTN
MPDSVGVGCHADGFGGVQELPPQLSQLGGEFRCGFGPEGQEVLGNVQGAVRGQADDAGSAVVRGDAFGRAPVRVRTVSAPAGTVARAR